MTILRSGIPSIDPDTRGTIPKSILAQQQGERLIDHRRRVAAFIHFGEANCESTTQDLYWPTVAVLVRLLKYYIGTMFRFRVGNYIEPWLHETVSPSRVTIGPIMIVDLASLTVDPDAKSTALAVTGTIIGVATGSHLLTYANRTPPTFYPPLCGPSRKQTTFRPQPLDEALVRLIHSSVTRDHVWGRLSLQDASRSIRRITTTRRTYPLDYVARYYPWIADDENWDSILHPFPRAVAPISDWFATAYVQASDLLPMFCHWTIVDAADLLATQLVHLALVDDTSLFQRGLFRMVEHTGVAICLHAVVRNSTLVPPEITVNLVSSDGVPHLMVVIVEAVALPDATLQDVQSEYDLGDLAMPLAAGPCIPVQRWTNPRYSMPIDTTGFVPLPSLGKHLYTGISELGLGLGYDNDTRRG
jgi:hypothetical protein